MIETYTYKPACAVSHCASNPDEETSSTNSESSAPSVSCSAFEGPEKNLEIDFCRSTASECSLGFRQVSREDLDAMMEAASCQILSKISNVHLDAYVLSESSLFVYAHKVILKTCGTTTLLQCLPLIIQAAEKLQMGINWISYSRKNYIFPEDQQYPHTSFSTEVAYLNDYFPHGSAHILGPLNDDHWYIYVWDAEQHCQNQIPGITTAMGTYFKVGQREDKYVAESTLHILMQGMEANVAKQFCKNLNPCVTSKEMTLQSGIRDLVPGARIDDVAFNPCGYSMNGILFDAYYTIHITPESHCSYASFETNARLRCYESLMKNVIRCFKPTKFTVTVFADHEALQDSKLGIFDKELVSLDDVQAYKRRGGNTQATFEGNYVCMMANWSLVQQKDPQFKKLRAPSFA